MILEQLLKESTLRLETAGVYSPREDAEKIIARILGMPREQLAGEKQRLLTDKEKERIESAIGRREKREPVARIFGAAEFCGLSIAVAEGVFEPLPESESLIEHAVESMEGRKEPLRVLDLGTGSGCLLLAALARLPNATGLGADLNPQAVALAKKNAERAGLAARASFQTGDWAEGIEGPFDLILSNPPFIPRRLIKTLMPEVRQHDPWPTLDGGRDGMRFYRQLARDFARLAAPQGKGFFQVSFTFAEQAQALFRKAGYGQAAVVRNYYGMPVGIMLDRAGMKNDPISRLKRQVFPL